MAQEIERKFLVAGDFKPFVSKATRITQGYLSSVPERTVRVRVKGEKGFITIEKNGRRSYYTPCVSQEDYLARQSKTFVEKLCGGSMSMFAAALCNSGLTKEELAELRDMLERGTL